MFSPESSADPKCSIRDVRGGTAARKPPAEDTNAGVWREHALPFLRPCGCVLSKPPSLTLSLTCCLFASHVQIQELKKGTRCNSTIWGSPFILSHTSEAVKDLWSREGYRELVPRPLKHLSSECHSFRMGWNQESV